MADKQTPDQPPQYQNYQVPEPHGYQASPVHAQLPVNSSGFHQTIEVENQLSIEEEDLYRVDGHVKVGFDEVFAEPKAYAKLEPVRNMFRLTFNYVQLAVYGFLTVIVGMLLAVFWGFAFAVTNFFFVWFVQPATKWFFMGMRSFAVFYRAFIRSFCDPWWLSVGQSLSAIGGRVKLNVTGIKSGNVDNV